MVISAELHSALKTRARKEGRTIIAVLAIAARQLLGRDFPRRCPETQWLPENLR